MTRRNTIADFEAKVVPEPNSGCWIWTGYLICRKPPKQYGRFKINNKSILAHIFSYELHKGPVPEGLVLDHLCRNTMCVNPEHLEPVTQKVNTRRGEQATKTHCKHGHNYVEGGFEYYYRKDEGQGERYRRCLTCYRMRFPGTQKRGNHAQP